MRFNISLYLINFYVIWLCNDHAIHLVLIYIQQLVMECFVIPRDAFAMPLSALFDPKPELFFFSCPPQPKLSPHFFEAVLSCILVSHPNFPQCYGFDLSSSFVMNRTSGHWSIDIYECTTRKATSIVRQRSRIINTKK